MDTWIGAGAAAAIGGATDPFPLGANPLHVHPDAGPRAAGFSDRFTTRPRIRASRFSRIRLAAWTLRSLVRRSSITTIEASACVARAATSEKEFTGPASTMM